VGPSDGPPLTFPAQSVRVGTCFRPTSTRDRPALVLDLRCRAKPTPRRRLFYYSGPFGGPTHGIADHGPLFHDPSAGRGLISLLTGSLPAVGCVYRASHHSFTRSDEEAVPWARKMAGQGSCSITRGGHGAIGAGVARRLARPGRQRLALVRAGGPTNCVRFAAECGPDASAWGGRSLHRLGPRWQAAGWTGPSWLGTGTDRRGCWPTPVYRGGRGSSGPSTRPRSRRSSRSTCLGVCGRTVRVWPAGVDREPWLLPRGCRPMAAVVHHSRANAPYNAAKAGGPRSFRQHVARGKLRHLGVDVGCGASHLESPRTWSTAAGRAPRCSGRPAQDDAGRRFGRTYPPSRSRWTGFREGPSSVTVPRTIHNPRRRCCWSSCCGRCCRRSWRRGRRAPDRAERGRRRAGPMSRSAGAAASRAGRARRGGGHWRAHEQAR